MSTRTEKVDPTVGDLKDLLKTARTISCTIDLEITEVLEAMKILELRRLNETLDAIDIKTHEAAEKYLNS